MMPTALVIQARLASSRLPGKVLKPLAGTPMLFWQAARLCRARRIDTVVFAISEAASDDLLQKECEERGFLVARGPSDDLVGRVAAARRLAEAGRVVRVWGDSPFGCPDILDAALAEMDARKALFVATSRLGERGLTYGLDFEVYDGDVLDMLDRTLTDPVEREFPIEGAVRLLSRESIHLFAPAGVMTGAMLCVDYPEDLEAANRLAEALLEQPDPHAHSALISVLRSRPDLANRFAKAPRNVEYNAARILKAVE